MMIIAIPIYEQVDLLDVAGPYEMLNWMNVPKKTVNVVLVSADGGSVTTRDGMTFAAHADFAAVPKADVIWVPGGDPKALKALMTDPAAAYLNYLRRLSAKARYTCSVCEGAMLLAAAGLLDGYQATTHWAFRACLERFPAIAVVDGNPRYVLDRDRLTGGGISSGLDEALALIELLWGTAAAQRVQVNTQYFPRPPVDAPLPPAPPCPFSW